jgi:riboflavin kinase/FMN adenylyltransferase
MFQAVTAREPFPPALSQAAVAIGNFDGVHRGHQAVINRTLDIARRENRPALSLTFEPHPRTFFKPDVPVFRLTPLPEKLLVFRALGLDGALIRDFDAALAAMNPQEFFEILLVHELNAAHLVAGEDFHFGKNRAGSPQILRELAQGAGLSVTLVAPEKCGAPISSSRIREALGQGDIALANQLLGYRWFVTGEVVHGDKRGRALKVPTANIAMPENFGLQHGIYAGRACAGGFWFGAALHFGTRMQFGGGAPMLEAHLLDFSGEIYGKTLRIEFMDYLRGEQKFADAPTLVHQMQADIEQVRKTVAASIRKPQSPLQTALDQACGIIKDA